MLIVESSFQTACFQQNIFTFIVRRLWRITEESKKIETLIYLSEPSINITQLCNTIHIWLRYNYYIPSFNEPGNNKMLIVLRNRYVMTM